MTWGLDDARLCCGDLWGSVNWTMYALLPGIGSCHPEVRRNRSGGHISNAWQNAVHPSSQHVRFSMKPSVARTCQNQFWWDAWVLLRPLMCLTPLACIVGQNKSAVRFLTRNKQKIIWPHVTVWGQMAGYLLDAKVAIWQAAQITQFAVVTHFLNSWQHGAGIESMLLMGAPVHKLKLRQNTDGVSWLLFVWNTNLLIGTQRWTNPVIPSNTAVI